MVIYGIDVSENQGNIGWREVKEDGVQFAMLRAGYGAGEIDVQFRKNAEGCTREQIPFGVYWCSYAYTPQMAWLEAESCMETVEEYNLSYPACFVYSKESMKYAKARGVTVTKRLEAELIDIFCTRIEERGYFSMYYSNKTYFNQMVTEKVGKKYPLWYAQYEGIPYLENMAIWQYTNKGRVRGIKGYVNENKAIWTPLI